MTKNEEKRWKKEKMLPSGGCPFKGTHHEAETNKKTKWDWADASEAYKLNKYKRKEKRKGGGKGVCRTDPLGRHSRHWT